MKSVMNYKQLSIVFILSFFSLFVKGQLPPLWGSLTPGKYKVGFKILYQYDQSRTYSSKTDLEGKQRAEKNRLLEIRMWYPAEVRSAAHPNYYSDYLLASKDHSSTMIRELTSRSIGITKSILNDDPDRYNKLLHTPVFAVHNAKPLQERFPLLVYSFGLTDGWDENIVLWEYLASKGYVVLISPSLGFNSIKLKFDQVNLETAIRDMEFLIAFGKKLPFVNASKIGALGFSYGGMVALGLSMRNTDVDAVAGIDPSFSHKQYQLTLKNAPYFNPESTTPLLHIYNDYEDVGLGLSDTLLYANRTRIAIANKIMNHIDFVSYTKSITYTLPDSLKEQRKLKTNGYGFVCRSTGAFFDHFLKGAPLVDYSTLLTPILSPNVSIKTLSNQPAPVNQQVLTNTLLDKDAKTAIHLLQQVKGTDTTNPILTIPVLTATSYEAILSGEYAKAIEFLEFAKTMYHNSPVIYDYIGEAYFRQGNKDKAIDTYTKMIELTNADQQMTENDKKDLIDEANSRIKVLKNKKI
jgi:tetratricopeptide (TPR) repeat protein